MNKKLLICGVIATGLLLSACVKKETPVEEETRAEVPNTQVKAEEKFENLTPTEPEQPAPVAEAAQPAAKKIEVIREETANTTTEIRRETRPVPAEPKPQVRTETAKAEPKPQANTEAVKTETAKVEAPRSSSNQSQDDAVAAAIAAATPALD